MTAVKVQEAFPGIFLVHLPLPMKPTIVNVYLVRGGDEWALIDTGINSQDSMAALREALDTVGCPPDRLGKIICTHHHPDHFGASKACKELTGATLYLHRVEKECVKAFAFADRLPEAIRFFLVHGIPVHRFVQVPARTEFWSTWYVTAPPDVFIDDGDVIEIGDRTIEVVWTPGHSPGHCVMYLRNERVLIAGDHLLPKITPHVGLVPNSVPNPLKDFLDSQRKVQQLDVELVLPAHGGPFRDHRHRAKQIIQHHHSRLQEIFDIVRREARTGYDVARRVFDFNSDSPLSYQFPATFEALAHLEYLRHQQRVTREERDAEFFYRAA